MIIDGLKEYILEYRNAAIFDKTLLTISKYHESAFRTVFNVDERLYVVEQADTITLNVVDNTGNVWRDIEDFEFTTREAFFTQLSAMLKFNREARSVLLDKNAEMIYNYIGEYENELLSITQISKALELPWERVAQLLVAMKNEKVITMRRRGGGGVSYRRGA